MMKRVFFSFHYDDVISFRANVVRQHHITKDAGEAGFFDASIWEDAELHGDASVKRLIDNNLMNTSVTCVLIGSNTWNRRWVRYEIIKSYERGNKLFGIHVNSIPDKFQHTLVQGPNPFGYLGFYIKSDGDIDYYQESNDGSWIKYGDLEPSTKNFPESIRNKGWSFSDWIPIHDWTTNSGYVNFPSWVEGAK